MPAKTLMIQGTASSVGKSVIVAGLCRVFHQDGLKVAPFKAQNMALNSFVTGEGGEIGRAQAVQAEAAGTPASVHMNPVLLKPEGEALSQVIVLGKVARRLNARQYYRYAPSLSATIEDSLNHLRSTYEIVVIEGAGSPAEINLKRREIVNMRVAKMANSPVLLVGDIDRGGIFASLIGTLELLSKRERDLIKGFIINKFRGDLKLLKPGLHILEKRTGKPVLGVLPYFRDVAIAQEDSVYLDERQEDSAAAHVRVAVIRLPHISNYDDFDPLNEHGCSVHYVTRVSELRDSDLIILPGTKSTIADLAYLQEEGLADAIVRQAKFGTPVIGVCGGYQMLGKGIRDPQRIESQREKITGLCLLNALTTFNRNKTTTQIKARVAAKEGLLKGMSKIRVTGYEIHMGHTTRHECQPAFQVLETPQGKANYVDGAISDDGLVFGTYVHGLFHNPEFTRQLLNRLRRIRGLPKNSTTSTNKEETYDRLADLIRQNLDMTQIYKIVFDMI